MICDLLIVGGGTAGLTAAIYGLRSGKSTIVVEGTSIGGQIITTPEVANYPGIKTVSGYEFAQGLLSQVKDLGGDIRSEMVLTILPKKNAYQVITSDDIYETKTIILATGSKVRKLEINGEEELVGKGVSYCATCDGSFYHDKIVAVNGGGNTALEDALVLSSYCKKVYLIHRRQQFRGEEHLITQVKNCKNIEMKFSKIIVKLIGTNQLEGVVLQAQDGSREEKIDLQGLFIAIGRIPDTNIGKGLVQLDDSGYIIAGEDCKTSRKGIYAAGDCRSKKVRQLTTAAADGAIAALAAVEEINGFYNNIISKEN